MRTNAWYTMGAPVDSLHRARHRPVYLPAPEKHQTPGADAGGPVDSRRRLCGGHGEDDLPVPAMALVKKYGAVVVTPEYRLAGETPYPAALEDCYTALRYLKEHAEELGVCPERLMVGGESAGGGLTAALCMLARDRGEVGIAYQMPLYPMLDDRDTDSSRANRDPVWNTKRNHRAWRAYLGPLWGGEAPPYAVPARADRLCRSAAGLHLCERYGAFLLRDHDLCGTPAEGRRGGADRRVPQGVPRV